MGEEETLQVELNPAVKATIDDYISRQIDDYLDIHIRAIGSSVRLVNNLNAQLKIAVDALEHMHEKHDKILALQALEKMRKIENG